MPRPEGCVPVRGATYAPPPAGARPLRLDEARPRGARSLPTCPLPGGRSLPLRGRFRNRDAVLISHLLGAGVASRGLRVTPRCAPRSPAACASAAGAEAPAVPGVPRACGREALPLPLPPLPPVGAPPRGAPAALPARAAAALLRRVRRRRCLNFEMLISAIRSSERPKNSAPVNWQRRIASATSSANRCRRHHSTCSELVRLAGWREIRSDAPWGLSWAASARPTAPAALALPR
jgi:hypothetical protein